VLLHSTEAEGVADAMIEAQTFGAVVLMMQWPHMKHVMRTGNHIASYPTIS